MDVSFVVFMGEDCADAFFSCLCSVVCGPSVRRRLVWPSDLNLREAQNTHTEFRCAVRDALRLRAANRIVLLRMVSGLLRLNTGSEDALRKWLVCQANALHDRLHDAILMAEAALSTMGLAIDLFVSDPGGSEAHFDSFESGESAFDLASDSDVGFVLILLAAVGPRHWASDSGVASESASCHCQCMQSHRLAC